MNSSQRWQPVTVDVHDDTQLRQIYDVMCAADAAARPHFNPPPFAGCQGYFRTPQDHHTTSVFAVKQAGRAVGVAIGTYPLASNTDSCRIKVYVTPQMQGQGVATALIATIEEEAASHNRRRLLGSALSMPPEDKTTRLRRREWAKRLGYHPAQEYVTYVLDLSTTELQRQCEVRAAAAAQFQDCKSSEYKIAVFHNDVPDDLLDAYTTLYCALNEEEPGGTVGDEKEFYTPDAIKDEMLSRRSRGEQNWYAIATCDGQAVAHSDVRRFSEDSVAHQLNTLVLREHRGNRLGLALKCAMIDHLTSTEPAIRSIQTDVNTANEAMMRVNTQLGFTPHTGEMVVRKDLA